MASPTEADITIGEGGVSETTKMHSKVVAHRNGWKLFAVRS